MNLLLLSKQILAMTVFIFGVSVSADTLTINDFLGDWQEVGHRCVGQTEFQPRDNTYTSKFFTIRDGSYDHRDEMHQWPGCDFVQSSGKLTAYPNGDFLDVLVVAETTKNCQEDSSTPLVDDFSPRLHPGPLFLRLDTINNISYMIISGNPIYIDKSCGRDNLVIERIYGRK